jgi:hypothetical protein
MATIAMVDLIVEKELVKIFEKKMFEKWMFEKKMFEKKLFEKKMFEKETEKEEVPPEPELLCKNNDEDEDPDKPSRHQFHDSVLAEKLSEIFLNYII